MADNVWVASVRVGSDFFSRSARNNKNLTAALLTAFQHSEFENPSLLQVM